ncbi:MAG TPA: hypothetical protein VHT28_06485 [Silvibacterium sp.]|nr:hypothetical protein [Silvibacterium sp.]
MESCLEQSVTCWQRIIEDRIVGEIPHGEIVDPGDGARLQLTLNIYALDAQLA